MLSVVWMVVHVAAIVDLPDRAVILRRRRSAQRSVVAVPQRHIVRAHQPFHRIRQVLRLQVGKLALLRAHFHVEQVVVDLRHQAFSGTLRSTRVGATSVGYDVPRIDERVRRRRRRNRRLFEEPRRMPRRRHLLDALPEHPAPPHDVGDFGW